MASKHHWYDDKNFWVPRVEKAKAANEPLLCIWEELDQWPALIKYRVSVIEQHIAPHESVLDVGCGHGWLSQEIPNHYTGVDQTPVLIEYARELYPGVRFVEGKAEELSFADNSFDWVICAWMKTAIIEAEGRGTMEKGKWAQIEKQLLRVAPQVLIFGSHRHEYEIISR
jgi:SAM-dependent methyltransferase